MIIMAVLNLFYDLADWLINSIPAIELPLSISDYIAPVANAVGYIDTFVSLPVLLLCITAVTIVDNWSFLVRLLIRLWELLPFN